jgi:hypothetical protein
VKSQTTEKFRTLFAAASAERQARILAAYKLWSTNPGHPSLRFKKVHERLPIYSARVDLDWRAVGILKDDTVVWFWVGSHQDYDALLKAI